MQVINAHLSLWLHVPHDNTTQKWCESDVNIKRKNY